MRRFISFRDFDWLLLGLVLLLSVISIFEIYSATLHTKFVGFETKQIFWLIGGLAAMFIFSLINYHRLSSQCIGSIAFAWFRWWRCWRSEPK